MATVARLIDWGVACLPLAGEVESGDRHVVTAFPAGVLVAAVDGLGHGPEAAAAARVATDVVQRYAGEPLTTLVERCDARLKQTRGAVMSLAALRPRDSTLNWLGVGNVDGVLLRADPAARPRHEWLLLRSGVVGYKLPPLRLSTLKVAGGDTLCLATDGIRAEFVDELTAHEAPQPIADRILARHATSSDDALVLVVRVLRGSHWAPDSRR